jgi:cytoskeleton protein RodZ
MPKVAQPAQPAVPPVSQPQPADIQSADVQPGPAQDAAPAPDGAPAANATVPATQPARNATAPAAASSASPAPAQPAAPTATQAADGAPQGGVFDSETAATGGADTEGSVLAGGTHRIVVIALADCWVHSSADDSDVRQFSLHKGQTFALTFSKRLTLKLGNAGGVRIRYNGQEQPAAGEPGQVRTLVFPPQAQ